MFGETSKPILPKTVKGWTKKCYREMIDDAEELELFEEEIAHAAERKTMDLQGLKEILMKLASDDYPINSKQETAVWD